jgi:uncharacterized protein
MASIIERVRDPLHDLIEFDDDEFERTMWKLLQTQAFQRLRRVRQLGFSEYTFPGATHTRFAHSLGVFHTARQLMAIIEKRTPTKDFKDSRARTALAAALLHDVGHGMFSHAFENVAKKLDFGMANHEEVSSRLIRESEIAGVLEDGGLDPAKVATLIARKGPEDLYDAVVSSQFDADRLDYMRRDRLMCGVQSGGIDFTWLVQNLEIGRVASSAGEADATSDAPPSTVQTFVLGSKAVMASEAYVLALFQLYPTVYFHKTTRAAEMVFKDLMLRVFRYLREGNYSACGLGDRHPFVRLVASPKDIDSILQLDDSVFWGSLPQFREAEDNGVQFLAENLRIRRLPKVHDLGDLFLSTGTALEIEKSWTKASELARLEFQAWNEVNSKEGYDRILFDAEMRDPYSQNEKKGRLNRIHVAVGSKVTDIVHYSPMIGSMQPFRFIRAYTYGEDHLAAKFVAETKEKLKKTMEA